MSYPGTVRVKERGGREPVVVVRETGEPTVVFVFWPGGPDYGRAMNAALQHSAAAMKRAVEAPCA